MTKNEARKYFTEKRNLIPEIELEKASLKIFKQWKESSLSKLDSFHIFLPIKQKKEVDTHPILKFLWENNKTVYCSKVNGKHLSHYLLTPETILKNNKWGIPEPNGQEEIKNINPECIFIPLLAYDLIGNRVGYGKGFYDRFLSSQSKSIKVGLSFFSPVNKINDISSEDIPINFIITTDYCLSFPIEEK